ncbi:MAG: hypothetical protein GX591_14695 [Planctomycetes bacterium]|nr:hypothetical protein [Planctomycetota bacterium]
MTTLPAILRLLRPHLLPVYLANASVVVLLTDRGGDLPWAALAPAWLAAAGLHVFAAAGGDLVDARRDRQRPPDERTNPIATGALADWLVGLIALAAAALAAGAAVGFGGALEPITVLAALGLTAVFLGGARRWPPAGLLLTALIQAAVAAMGLTGEAVFQWWAVPGILGAHTLLVSAFAYAWEGRRPPLYGNNWFHLLVATGAVLAVLTAAAQRWSVQWWPSEAKLNTVFLTWGLFALVFAVIFTRVSRARRGAMLRLVGMNWLILLDLAFVTTVGADRATWLFLVLLAAVPASMWLLGRVGAGRT